MTHARTHSVNTHYSVQTQTHHSQTCSIFSLLMRLSESAAVDVKHPAARRGNFLRKSERPRRREVEACVRLGGARSKSGLADVREEWKVLERVKINEQKVKVDVSAAEGRLSKEEGSEREEGRFRVWSG